MTADYAARQDKHRNIRIEKRGKLLSPLIL